MKWNPFALEAEAKKEVYKLIDKNCHKIIPPFEIFYIQGGSFPQKPPTLPFPKSDPI